MSRREETPQNTSGLLLPRAKWNTAQVKLVSLSMSQVIKLTMANKLNKKDGEARDVICNQGAHLVAIPMFTAYRTSLLTALRVLEVRVRNRTSCEKKKHLRLEHVGPSPKVVDQGTTDQDITRHAASQFDTTRDLGTGHC